MKRRCPACRLEQEVTLWGSVNSSLNPDLKERLLTQELLRLRCRDCREILLLGYPLLYHDMNRRFMAAFSFEQDDALLVPPPFMAGYRLRAVGTPSQLIEKILAVDANLDDQALELVKLSACAELLAAHEPALARLGALPLQAARLHFVGTLTTPPPHANPNPGPSPTTPSPEIPAQLLFLLLSRQQLETPLMIEIDASALRLAARRLEEQPASSDDRRRWHRINAEWAKIVLGHDPIPVHLALAPASSLLPKLPVAASLWQNHVELASRLPAGD